MSSLLLSGTIDLQSNALANAMVEAKTQIRVFEEIEEIGHNHYKH